MTLVKQLFSKLKSPSNARYASTPDIEHPDPLRRHSNIDGYWHCQDCGIWYPLKYNTGIHPFAKLKCPQCKVNFQPTWEITRVAKSFNTTADDPIAVPKLKHGLEEQVPFFTVCGKCGLTWRARNLTSSICNRSKRVSVMKHHEVDKDSRPEQSYVGFAHIECECGSMHGQGRWRHFSIRNDAVYHLKGDGYLFVAEKNE